MPATMFNYHTTMTDETIITTPIIDNDIESNVKKNEYEKFTKLKGILIKPPTQAESSLASEKLIALCMYIVILIFCFPLVFCDYYFAINNSQCMQQKLHISLTMYDYLMVNAILGSTFLLATFIIFMTIDFKNYDEDRKLLILIKIINIIVSLFSIAWIVTGGIMYWGEMDKDLCSSSANDYLMATLIIKMICVSCEIYNRSGKKSNKVTV